MHRLDQMLLVRLYRGQPLSSDKLAYTKEMRGIWKDFNCSSQETWSEGDLFHHLMKMRKGGKLPRVAKK